MSDCCEIINNKVLISQDDYTEYIKLKRYRCRVIDDFSEMKMLIKRLLMLEELFDFSGSTDYSSEDIKNNLDATIDELFCLSKKYEMILNTIDFKD